MAGGRWEDVPAELRSAPILMSRELRTLSWEELNKGALALPESSFEAERCRLLRKIWGGNG
jgi:hypothetical protein